MLTENLQGGLQPDHCNHERSHIGLDRAYCPDCKAEFRSYSKDYQRLLQQRPLILNHPDPKPGDRVTLLGDSPQRLYEIVKIAGGHAICKALDGNGSNRNVAYWKLRAYCASSPVLLTAQDNCAASSSPASPTPPSPAQDAFTPDTCGEISRAIRAKLIPDTCGKVSGVNLDVTNSNLDVTHSIPTSTFTPDTRGATHWAEVYRPNQRDTKYFRYVWMVGQKMHRAHIPGGNVRRREAQLNLAEVELAIDKGRSPAEILELIKKLRGGQR